MKRRSFSKRSGAFLWHDALEAIREDIPDNVELLYYLGRSCAKTSWKKEGVEYLEKAIKLSTVKDSTMARLYRGVIECYKMAGRYQDQVSAMKALYSYDRNNHQLWYDMAFIYNNLLKDKKEAERKGK